MLQAILSVLWVIVATALVLVLAYWATRFLAGRMGAGTLVRSRRIEILEQVPVGRDQKLMLARLGDKTCFLAATPGGITVLREATEAELQQAQQEQSGQPPFSDAFARALRQVMEQRNKGG